MREEVQNSAKLFFSNELLLSRIYSVWALASMVLFGFFAVGSLTFNLTKKVNLIKEMRAVNYDLNVKLQSLNKLSGDLSETEKYQSLLDNTLPKELNTHSYMVSVMQQAATAGFGVKNFISSDESMGQDVPIVVVLEGNGDLSALISGLEALQRVTVIDSVAYEIQKDTTKVTILLRIFNL